MKSSDMKKSEDKTKNAKDEYVEKRKAQIDKLNTELEELDARITTADADAEAKLKHKELVAALRQKRDEARTKLTEIQSASDDRWEALKHGVESTWTSFRDGFEKVKAKF